MDEDDDVPDRDAARDVDVDGEGGRLAFRRWDLDAG